MEHLNALALKRLRYVEEYVELQNELSLKMDAARLNISKARTIHGVSLTNVAQLDNLELSSSTRVIFDENDFTVMNPSSEIKATVSKRKNVDTTDSENAKEPAASHEKPQFRPFGILEPLPAKEARTIMASCVPIFCQLATIQSKIRNIEKDMSESIKSSELGDTNLLLECLSVN